jgi:divalent metal cation (Fe/Co/Zn/Cd) transporter
VAIGVLVFAILLEGYSWLAATREVNHLRGTEGFYRFIKSSKSTEIIVIWMEDTGAMIGLILALTGVCLASITGNPLWDVYATFGIGVLMVSIAIFVGAETKSLLIGEAATEASQNTIRELITATPGVVRMLNMRTMQLGDDQFLAAIKLQWEPELTAAEIAARTNALEARIRKAIVRARYLFIESDVYDPNHDEHAAAN